MGNRIFAGFLLLALHTALAQAAPDKSTAFFVLKSPRLTPHQICSGSVKMELPSLAACPDGYIGIATCTQTFEVPQKLQIDTTPPISGAFCVLDFDNKVAVSALSCDYSRCIKIEEPEVFDVNIY